MSGCVLFRAMLIWFVLRGVCLDNLVFYKNVKNEQKQE